MTIVAFRSFEEEVKNLLASELIRDIATPIKVFRGRKYRGKSGTSHEIDVAFETKIARSKLVFVVECKFYSRAVGIDKVRDFAYRIRDIGAHKGLMVTNLGYQRGAKSLAKAEGIGLLVVAGGRLMPVGGLPVSSAQRWICALSLNLNAEQEEINLTGERLRTIDRLGVVFPIDPAQGPNYDPWDHTSYSFRKRNIIDASFAFLLPDEADAIGFKSFSPLDSDRHKKYASKARFSNVFGGKSRVPII